MTVHTHKPRWRIREGGVSGDPWCFAPKNRKISSLQTTLKRSEAVFWSPIQPWSQSLQVGFFFVVWSLPSIYFVWCVYCANNSCLASFQVNILNFILIANGVMAGWPWTVVVTEHYFRNLLWNGKCRLHKKSILKSICFLYLEEPCDFDVL